MRRNHVPTARGVGKLRAPHHTQCACRALHAHRAAEVRLPRIRSAGEAPPSSLCRTSLAPGTQLARPWYSIAGLMSVQLLVCHRCATLPTRGSTLSSRSILLAARSRTPPTVRSRRCRVPAPWPTHRDVVGSASLLSHRSEPPRAWRMGCSVPVRRLYVGPHAPTLVATPAHSCVECRHVVSARSSAALAFRGAPATRWLSEPFAAR